MALTKITGDGVGTGAAGMGPAFAARPSSGQSAPSTETFTKVAFGTETFDTDGCYDNSSNYRFTPTSAGKYQVGMQVRFNGSALQEVRLSFRKNGSGVHAVGSL